MSALPAKRSLSIGTGLSAVGERAGQLLKATFGSRNQRFLRTLVPLVNRIGQLEPWARGLAHAEFERKTAEWRDAVRSGVAQLDNLLPEAFALVREASRRTLGLRHYDVQMLGGIVLHGGSITEMMTGEGKTLVATLPLYLNALAGRGAYLVTVNDYLAARDAAWMRPVYSYLGLLCGALQTGMSPPDRRTVYSNDIVYGTNSEFGFDFLRDNMQTDVAHQVQRTRAYAIIDEVDSILIDEARTPLIISGPAQSHVARYAKADRIARTLVSGQHYEVKEKERTAALLEEGILAAQELAGVESFYQPGYEDWPHYIENAIRAHELYLRDKEYVVEAAEVGGGGLQIIIVDEFTGRKMHGRRWSSGLHQAIEVKEGLEPEQETQTLATITFQNYFRMFDKLAGMTGTAITEAREFHKIYDLDVVAIPPNRPITRSDNCDVVYLDEGEKFKAVCEEVARVHERGQPVLIGTTSVERSERLSKMLTKQGISHEVLNAKNHEREAHIVARAGERGAVTVATNMAGRGTDIKLGGNFEYRLGMALEQAELAEGALEHQAEIDVIRRSVREQCERDEEDVLGCGGLYVLGTERHESRRIDNQLRGRSGRQGDAGQSRFFLSLQDDLLRIFYRDWVTTTVKKLGMVEGQEIESGMVTRAIAKAQRKVEERNFETRKKLLEEDEVMDLQRKTIYGVRQRVLDEESSKDLALEMIANAIERAARLHCGSPGDFDDWCQRAFGFDMPAEAVAEAVGRIGCTDKVKQALVARYREREVELGEELVRRAERYVVLKTIDSRWKDHLFALDALKTGIGLRGYGQQDPKIAYKKEGTELFFGHLLPAIEDDVASLLMRIQVSVSAPLPESRTFNATEATPLTTARNMSPMQSAGAASTSSRGAAIDRQRNGHRYAGVGRNAPCPCGSGKKLKKCHRFTDPPE